MYGRYASALYSAASKQKSLDKVESELKDFHATIAKDSRLAEFIANPTLKRSLKKDALISVAKKLKMSAVTGNFLGKFSFSIGFHFILIVIHMFIITELLAENGRLNKLDVVTGHFFNMMAAFRGEVVCEVTSAKVKYKSKKI